jgi:hypothetical protein
MVLVVTARMVELPLTLLLLVNRVNIDRWRQRALATLIRETDPRALSSMS